MKKKKKEKTVLLMMIVGLMCCSAADYNQTEDFGVKIPGDLVGFTATPPGTVISGAVVNPGGFTWTGSLATWNGIIPDDFRSNHRGRFDGRFVVDGTEPGGVLTWRVDTMASVLKVEITEPNEEPVTDNNFTFNSDSPGVCSVTATGTTGKAEEDHDLRWTLTLIDGSTRTSNPDPPKGANITFTHTTLPGCNKQFGKKTLTLKHPKLPAGNEDTQIVEIFFLRDEKNNPEGTNPNWYYYWGQITGKENLAYGGNNPRLLGVYDYNGARGHLDKCIIYDTVTTSGNDDEGGGYGPPGIDSFGQTVIHERKHREQFWEGFTDTTGDGIPDYDRNKDEDRDWLSDSYEDANGFDKNDRNSDSEDDNGNGILDAGEDKNGNGVLDGDRTLDLEEEPEAAEAGWPQDSRNNQDWAKPGKNWL